MISGARSKKRRLESVTDNSKPTRRGTLPIEEDLHGVKIFDKRYKAVGKWTPTTMTYRELLDVLFPTFTLKEVELDNEPIDSPVGQQSWFCDATKYSSAIFTRQYLMAIYEKLTNEVNPIGTGTYPAVPGVSTGASRFTRLMPDLQAYGVSRNYCLQNTGKTVCNVTFYEFLCVEDCNQAEGPIELMKQQLKEEQVRHMSTTTQSGNYAPTVAQTLDITDPDYLPKCRTTPINQFFKLTRQTSYDVPMGAFINHYCYWPGATIKVTDLYDLSPATGPVALDTSVWLKGVSRCVLIKVKGQYGWAQGNLEALEGGNVVTSTQLQMEVKGQATFRAPLRTKSGQSMQVVATGSSAWSTNPTNYAGKDDNPDGAGGTAFYNGVTDPSTLAANVAGVTVTATMDD